MPIPLRVLILEDNLSDAELEVAILKEFGYDCRWKRVETQTEFLACLAPRPPDYDLILADYNLPTFNGLTALKLFLERDLDLPFILVSGALGEETAIESLRAGVTDYVLKDRLPRLGPVVQRAMREKEERQRLKQAKAEIARLDAVIEQATVTVIVTDLDGNIIYANPDFETSTGYTVAEALGQNLRILKGNQRDDAFYQELWNTITRGETWCGTFVNKRKNGDLYHEDTSIFPIRDSTGEIVNYAAIKKDVTRQVQAEEALRESEKRFRLAAESTSDLIYEWDVASDRLLWFGDIDKALGFEPGEFPRTIEAWVQRIHPDDQGQLADSVERHRTFTQPIYDEYRVQQKDGTWRHWIDKGIPVLDNEARPYKWIGACVDVTERVQTEEERERLLAQIREQARQIRQIMDTVPEGVLLLDADGRVVMTNPVAERNLTVLAGAKVGDTLTHLGNRLLTELLTSPPTRGLWHQVTTEDKIFQVIARPMENGPEPEDWVLVISDVTQKREVQRRVQQQERLAAVGQLAAGIAHDFNNIMATIVLYAQMTARAEGLPAKVRERMATINQQAMHATHLIQQILDFSRRAVLEQQPLDLAPLLKEQVELLERTLPESIQINLDYDEHAALLLVNADPTRMQQMVTNLALNARDAMPEGGELRVGLERIEVLPGESPLLPEIEAGEWVRVTVSDTGTGIPPDALPHIFEPFFTTRAPLGSGLGLAQVYGIVKQHEGHIAVDTQLGQGTTFTLYLPALTPHQPEPSRRRRERLVQGQGQMILVVEDNDATRKALASSLEMLNYRTLEAANGQEALVVLAQHASEITLVLSDVVMPEMGGRALFQALRLQYPTVRVVLLTGHPLEQELENLQAQGLSGWLLKPPSLERLAEVVARALNP